MHRIEELIKIVKMKVQRDKKGTWSEGSVTYFQAMFDELEEVRQELNSDQNCYLEDELGDILWVYLCFLQHLDEEGSISMDNVFTRALDKYKTRVEGINAGIPWNEIKKKQKKALQEEQNNLSSD